MTVSAVSAFEWSVDGNHIFYTSNDVDSGPDDIFRVSGNGGQSIRLGQDEPGVRPEPKEELTLSADGTTRYFQAFSNIFRMPASGGVAEALTFNDAVIQANPAISPDGNTLAFFARTDAGAKIYTLDLTHKKCIAKTNVARW
jgi:Tol biopolymer transport system component